MAEKDSTKSVFQKIKDILNVSNRMGGSGSWNNYRGHKEKIFYDRYMATDMSDPEQVKEFQSFLGLESDGIVGPNTKKAIKKIQEDYDYITKLAPEGSFPE